MSSQTLGQLECRSYVYVIECQSCDGTEHDHWYVGVASPGHLSTRLDQHWSSKAARWTRSHKPVRVAAVHRAPAEGDAVMRLEKETTLQIMKECIERHGEHGWLRVRGGPWCSEHMSQPPPGLNNCA
jgi:predicted GIY-YIG superfamily endonuclease